MAKILKAENIQTDLIGSNGNNAFSLQRNSSSLLTLSTSDRVGIGTTSPSYRLTIQQSSGTDSQLGLVTTSQIINTGSELQMDLTNASNQQFEGGNIQVRHTSSNQTAGAENSYMSFSTRGTGTITERLRIDSSGNVGIGTSSPSQKLDVNGGSAIRGTIFIGDGSSSVIRKITANTPLNFANSLGSAEMTIDSSGRIGIGTISPRGRIDAINGTISGETGAQCIFPLSITIGYGGSSYGSIGYNLDYRNATSNTSGVKYLAADTISQIDFDSGGFIFRNSAAGIAGNTATLTERFRIDSSGNVGIGTTNPAGKLDVYGDIYCRNIELGKSGLTGNRITLIDFTSDDTYTDYGLRISRDANGPDSNSVIRTRGTGILYLYVQEAGSIGFATNSLDRLRIDSSGNVGIGTVSPINKLQVHNGSIAASSLGDSNDFIRIRMDSNNNSYGILEAMWDNNSALPANVIINPNGGNVGIGTTNPTTKLHVNGVITHSAGTIGSNANGTRTVTNVTTTPTGGSDGDIVYVI